MGLRAPDSVCETELWVMTVSGEFGERDQKGGAVDVRTPGAGCGFARKAMNKVIVSVIECLDARQCRYELDEARQVLRFDMEGGNAHWQCLARQDNAGRFILASRLPLHAPPARRVACAELFARINARLGFGHFELDFSDGQLAYRTAIPIAKRGRLPRDLVGHVLQGHHVLVDQFVPAISAVLFAGVAPVKVLAPAVEPPMTAESRLRISLN